jgi:hypothetical protein
MSDYGLGPPRLNREPADDGRRGAGLVCPHRRVEVDGSFTTLDLIAAGTNALNRLLARRPDHYKNFTVIGIMGMALLTGLGGRITRDVLRDLGLLVETRAQTVPDWRRDGRRLRGG